MPPRRRKQPYPWVRQEGETELAYEAFQVYLRLGTGRARSISKAAAKLGKTSQALEGWSARYNWVARVTAYDQHITTVETDDLAQQLAESRDEARTEDLELVRKLRGHLSRRLDVFIQNDQDPSIRWCSALTAMVKVEQSVFTMQESDKTSEWVETIMEKLDRLDRLGVEASE